MKPIKVRFIEHSGHRYPTVGDYFESSEAVHFRVTEFPGKPAYSIAVLLHEIAEYYRTQQDGIEVKDIDAFDIAHPELDDPGLEKAAPYHQQHMEADALERLFILFSGEDWADYEEAINNLSWESVK